MQFQFSFKHMETSTALQNYTQEKIRTKVEKFVTKPIEVKVTFSVDRHIHRINCALLSGDGFSMSLDQECADMYGSVDLLVDRLGVQLKKKKDRLKEHKNKGTVRTMPERYEDDSYMMDAGDIIKYEEAMRRRRAS